MFNLKNMQLRWKLLIMVLPLVLVPILIVGSVVGYISNSQAYLGITQTSKDDLQHMSSFTLDMLSGHYKQYQAYKQDKVATVRQNIGDYHGEIDEDLFFKNEAFTELKKQLKSKKVGKTGYIYVMDIMGNLMIHPFREGKNIINEQDDEGRYFIREMCEKKEGWIRYPWKNAGENSPRMKIVHYQNFEPWNWIVAVGSYEDEFYGPAYEIKKRILTSMSILILVVGVCASFLVFIAAKVFNAPIYNMIEVIRKVKQGRLGERMPISTQDELGELATAFNEMTDILERNKELEFKLAKQQEMASLGVLSAGIAHEINNPLGVILGYAAHLEGKLEVSDPHHKIIKEIKQESRRCMKIVKDLLSYTKSPQPTLTDTDLNQLLHHVVDFAHSHQELQQISIIEKFDSTLPIIQADEDQIRQVAINLISNAGFAMSGGGQLIISTSIQKNNYIEITFEDSGEGVDPLNHEQIFEPFFTTKSAGTGLGLAISKQIIESHHGSISVAGKLDRGTTVTIRLPIES